MQGTQNNQNDLEKEHTFDQILSINSIPIIIQEHLDAEDNWDEYDFQESCKWPYNE